LGNTSLPPLENISHKASSHGLSYTTFAYSDLKISAPSSCKEADQFNAEVSFKITNTGPVRGHETAQLYISLPPTPWNHAHPRAQLRGFTKVKDIEPGETRKVKIGLDKYAVSYWEDGIKSWRADVGVYGVLVGASSDDVRLNGSFQMEKVFEWSGL
jgi:beta-glucosidase